MPAMARVSNGPAAIGGASPRRPPCSASRPVGRHRRDAPTRLPVDAEVSGTRADRGGVRPQPRPLAAAAAGHGGPAAARTVTGGGAELALGDQHGAGREGVCGRSAGHGHVSTPCPQGGARRRRTVLAYGANSPDAATVARRLVAPAGRPPRSRLHADVKERHDHHRDPASFRCRTATHRLRTGRRACGHGRILGIAAVRARLFGWEPAPQAPDDALHHGTSR